MLKLIYTENEFRIERTTNSLETLITQRVILATRLGESLHVEPSTAAFLVPNQAEGLLDLELSLSLEEGQILETASVDAEFVEVSVRGTWIAKTLDAEEGIFLVSLGDRTEQLLHKLWEAAREQVSFLG
jgi:hypothetical protein